MDLTWNGPCAYVRTVCRDVDMGGTKRHMGCRKSGCGTRKLHVCWLRLDGQGHERDVVESGVARAVRDKGDDMAEMRHNSQEA